jgi:hypothetical protein
MPMAFAGFIATGNKKEAMSLAKCFMDKIPETIEEIRKRKEND